MYKNEVNLTDLMKLVHCNVKPSRLYVITGSIRVVVKLAAKIFCNNLVGNLLNNVRICKE